MPAPERRADLRGAKTGERSSAEALRCDRIRSSEKQSQIGATKKAESAILAPGARRRCFAVPIAFYFLRPNSMSASALTGAGRIGFFAISPCFSLLFPRATSSQPPCVCAAETKGDLARTADKIIGVVYEDRVSHARRRLAFNPLFVQIGLRPNTEWLVDKVTLSPCGETTVDERVRTLGLATFATGNATMESRRTIAAEECKDAAAECELLDCRLRSSALRTQARAV